MTAEVIPLRRPRLETGTVRDALEALARGWDDNTDPRRWNVLRELTHPSLTTAELHRLWGDYRRWLSVRDDFGHGSLLLDWHDFVDTGGSYESAQENVRGECEYALLDLIEGPAGWDAA